MWSGCQGDSEMATNAVARVGRGEPVEGRVLTIETRTAEVGATVRFSAANWQADSPLEFFLLEEPDEFGFAAVRAADKVLLGEVEGESGNIVYEFILRSEFQTQDGNLLEVIPGMRLLLVGLQILDDGSSSSARPFEVR